MNILFIGAFAPDYLVKEFPNQGLGKYQVSQFMIEGLKKMNGANVYTITSPDLRSYPSFPKLYIKARNEDSIELVSSLNMPIIKNLWTIVSLLLSALKFIKKNQVDYIILPYMVYRHVIVGRFIQFIFRNKVKVCLVIPDIFFPNKSQIIGYILNKWTERQILHFDRFVLYTKQMASYLKLEKSKFIVMEGILDVSKFQQKITNKSKDCFRIVYAGSLAKQYGILRLIDSMKHIESINVTLELYGDGDAVSEIKNISKLDRRIQYKGWLSKEDVFNVMQNANVLINPRNKEDGEFTEYSCPSKIMEYLLSGTPSIICPLPGIPEEYYPYFILTNGTSIDIAEKISLVLNFTNDDYIEWANKAISFIKNRVGLENQVYRIYNLLQD